MNRSATLLLLSLLAAACAAEDNGAPAAEGEAEGAADSQPTISSAAPATDTPGCWLQRGTVEEAGQRASPRDSASVSVAGGTLEVCYGGPSARGRTIVGGIDPYGQPWRMGADEATALHTTVPIEVGGTRLEPGTYSVYGIPTEGEWTIVLNSNHQRWGIPIDESVRATDVAQVTVTPEAADAPVETLQYRFEPRGDSGVDLIMEFESRRVRLPIEVADG